MTQQNTKYFDLPAMYLVKFLILFIPFYKRHVALAKVKENEE